MSKQRETHKQALRQLLNQWSSLDEDREELIDAIIQIGDRFSGAPAWLDEALNSGDGTYKP